MSSHFESIGLRLPDAKALVDFVGKNWSRFQEELRGDDTRHLRWTDPSGASLAVHEQRGEVVCLTPFFDPPEGPSRWTVRSNAPREDEECVHCGGADVDVLVDGEMVTRSTVQWLQFMPYRKWLRSSREYSLTVVGFTEKLILYPDEAAFDRGPQLEGLGSLRLAVSSFLPFGMFEAAGLGVPGGVPAPVGVRRAARASISGRISKANRRENTQGTAFWHLRVDSLPGQLDVVAPLEALDGPPPAGAIALLDAWLVARPVDLP